MSIGVMRIGLKYKTVRKDKAYDTWFPMLLLNRHPSVLSIWTKLSWTIPFIQRESISLLIQFSWRYDKDHRKETFILTCRGFVINYLLKSRWRQVHKAIRNSMQRIWQWLLFPMSMSFCPSGPCIKCLIYFYKKWSEWTSPCIGPFLFSWIFWSGSTELTLTPVSVEHVIIVSIGTNLKLLDSCLQEV